MRENQTFQKNPSSLTIAEAASMAGRSYAWVYDRVADGRISATRPNGRHIFIDPAEFRKFVAAELAWGSKELASMTAEQRRKTFRVIRNEISE